MFEDLFVIHARMYLLLLLLLLGIGLDEKVGRRKDAPVRACTTTGTWSVSSCPHTLFSCPSNQAMFDTQVALSTGVLHVPQISTLSSVLLSWA